MKRFTILLGLAVLSFAPVVLADVPKLINFQGVLRDGSGNPVPDAVYVIRFRIYDDSTAGANLWEEFDDVQTTDGLFNVRLGDTTDLPNGLFEGSVNRFVGVKVGGDPETAPRTRLISVPFAFHTLKSDSAVTATVALDLTCTGCVVGGVSGTILDGSITSEDLGTNSVAADEIAPGAVGTNEIDATQVQRRVTGTAGANQYITAINQDGSVVTAIDQVGAASGWTDDGAVVRLSTGTDNVGIGTTTTQFGARLEVVDRVNVIGSGTSRVFIAKDGNEYLDIIYNAGSARGQITTNNSSQPLILQELGGNVGIGTTTPAQKLDVAGSIKGDTVFSNVLSSNSPLNLQAPAGTTRMYIDDLSGDVGLGTAAPSRNLHIFQDVNASVGLRIDNPNVGGVAQERIDFGSSGLANITVFGGSNGMSIVNNRTSGLIDFETGGSTRVRIANNGRVAIGTLSQQNTLDVGGNAAIGASFAGTSAPANGLLVEGNVGIGTTSPLTRLQVSGGRLSVDGGTDAAPAYTFAGDLNTGIYNTSPDFISIATGGAEQVRVGPTGTLSVISRAQIGSTTLFGDPSTLYVQGSIATGITTVVGPTTLTSSNSVVLVNTGATTITLPGAVFVPGRQYTIKKISAAAGIITVDGAGADTIDGAATHSLTVQYEYVTIVSNGTSWFVVADN